jgi:N-methylhydantoinase A
MQVFGRLLRGEGEVGGTKNVVSYRCGVDIGGTFTDIVVLGEDGSFHTRKVLSTPDDYGDGIVAGIEGALADLEAGANTIRDLVHATTVATNIILEQKGACTALVTTAGFRDVLEMRRLRIPVLYDLQYRKPPPLVPRRLRFEVAERMGPAGVAWRPLDEASVHEAAEGIAAAGAEAVAISLLHAYANPAHEKRVAAILRERLGAGVFIACSSDILPEIREYERTSTAVVNAYIGPAVGRYVDTLVSRLRASGLDGPVQVMQSGGGIMPAEMAARKPAYIVESGPAAGVIACARLARRAGFSDAISFDMGGTTAKAAMVENGEPAKTTEYEVGAGINLSSKLVKGGGYPIKLPFIDVSEIGAGGGSIVSFDEAGSLRVGPQSAGSDPGPVCYGRGGRAATLTDSFLLLGYLNPAALAGGSVPISVEPARRAFVEQVAEPLRMPPMEAAYGVFELAAATMTRAVKAVSTYRGRDPRRFALIAFGGNGPVVAPAIANALEMPVVLIPPAPGVFSAAGLLFSDVEREFMRTLFRRATLLDTDTLETAFAGIEAGARAELTTEGHDLRRITLRRFGDFRYAGQAYELSIACERDLSGAIDAFHAEHERTYGYRSETESVELVNLKVLASVGREGPGENSVRRRTAAARPERRRGAYFGRQHGFCDTAVIDRASLAPDPRQGPLIIEEYDATCVVPPNATARLDPHGNIEIRLA